MKKIDFSHVPFKKILILLASFVVCFSLFFVLWKGGHELFAGLAFGTVALGVAAYYIIYNHGTLGKMPTAEELPAEWDEETRNNVIEDLKARRKKSAWALYVLLPIAFTFAVKMLDIAIFSKYEIFARLSELLS